MTDQIADAALSGSEVQDIALPEHKAGGDGPLSPREAARSLMDWRRKSAAEENQDESAETPPPVEESTEEVDAAPPQEATGETEEQTDPELPPLDLPRSWTKEQAEHWKALPRATQEYLIEQAGKESAAVRKAQNEAAEHRKAIEAERQSVGQLRAQYESALSAVYQQLQSAQAGEFSDIKSMKDVNRLAAEDPVRFTKWNAHQIQLAAVQREKDAAAQRQMDEMRQHFETFKVLEAAKLLEKAPELSDQEAMKRATESAVQALRDLEFSDQELSILGSGQEGLSVHDHRFQLLLMKAMKYDEAQKKQQVAQKTVVEKLKSVPPVQKPGTVKGKGAQVQAEIANLQKQLENASGRKALEIAAKLRQAQSSLRG